MRLSNARGGAPIGGAWLIMLAGILWGTGGPTTQALYNLTATTPLSINFFRMGIAAPILAVVCWRMFGRRMFAIPRRDLAVILGLGMLVALDQAAYFFAIAGAGVAVATLITICASPVIVAIASAVIYRERIAARVLIALACALVGTALLVGLGGESPRAGFGVGVVFALLSAFGYSGVIMVGRFLAGRYHPLQVTTIGFFAGSILLFALANIVGFVTTYPVSGWLMLLYLGIGPTALAYGLFLNGMRSTPAPVASILVLLEPLTATVLAWLLFGEEFGPLRLVGAVILCCALLILAQQEGKKPALSVDEEMVGGAR